MPKDIQREFAIPVSGTLHHTMHSAMKRTYENLYVSIKNSYPIESLSMFFPLEGTEYRESMQWARILTEEEVQFETGTKQYDELIENVLVPAVRLMVVGRCVNGWTDMPDESPEEFSIRAARDINVRGFHWLRNDGTATDTYIRKYDGKESRYNINRSAFWRSIKNVLNILKPYSTLDERWFEHIVWSNLYPVAPKDEGNADTPLKKHQLIHCRDLLLQQIKLFNPSHILFITDWDGWFDDFADLFDVKRNGDSATDNVVAAGNYKDKRVVVAVRPDRTRPNRPNEKQFADDIVSAFKNTFGNMSE